MAARKKPTRKTTRKKKSARTSPAKTAPSKPNGAPVYADLDDRQRCVIDHSVYNALSFSQRDMTADDLLAFFRSPPEPFYPWAPAWDPQGESLTEAMINSAAASLESRKLIQRVGAVLMIPVRNPYVPHLGPPIVKDVSRTRLIRGDG